MLSITGFESGRGHFLSYAFRSSALPVFGAFSAALTNIPIHRLASFGSLHALEPAMPLRMTEPMSFLTRRQLQLTAR